MSGRQPGRPRSGTPTLTRDAIVEAATDLLDRAGPQGFSMRALGAELGVSPMALYHHVGPREALLAIVAETVYAGIDEPVDGTAQAQIEKLLVRYCERVLAHPGMTLAIFADARLYAGPTERLTKRLGKLLVDTGLERAVARHWRDILVDFTHGFAIACAAAKTTQAQDTPASMAPYREQLTLLLDCIASPLR